MTHLSPLRVFPTLSIAGLALAFGMGARECHEPPPPAGSCTVGNITYEDGARSIPSPDGCNTCACEDGALTCTQRACASSNCVVDGVTRVDNERFPAADGCNTCTCNDGEVACTEIACESRASCTVGDATYPHGQTGIPAPDGCNTCTCNDGELACTEIGCQASCEVFGRTYQGTAPSADGCNTCGCEDGQVTGACTELDCVGPSIQPCTDWSEFPSDPYTLDSVSVEGDVLTADVSYGGGCAPHYFRLCYEPAFLESDPVQSNLRLEHDGQGDRCDAWVTEARRFDLRPLARAWQEGYRQEHGTVILRIGGGARYDF